MSWENVQTLSKLWRIAKIAIFHQFLDVFSAQGDRINFWSFACYQASWDTILEYPQRVFWSNLKIHFLGVWVWGTFRAFEELRIWTFEADSLCLGFNIYREAYPMGKKLVLNIFQILGHPTVIKHKTLVPTNDLYLPVTKWKCENNISFSRNLCI